MIARKNPSPEEIKILLKSYSPLYSTHIEPNVKCIMIKNIHNVFYIKVKHILAFLFLYLLL